MYVVYSRVCVVFNSGQCSFTGTCGAVQRSILKTLDCAHSPKIALLQYVPGMQKAEEISLQMFI